MTYSPGRRKSSQKSISGSKQPLGPMLKFKWSISAAHLASLEDDSAVVLPPIVTNRAQRKNLAAPSSATEYNSVSQYSVSTQKSSSLPSIVKQCKSPSTTTEQDKSSPRASPLVLTYAQLHRSPPPSPTKRCTQARLSIYPVSPDKRSRMSIISEKISLLSRPSIVPTPAISVLSNKANYGLANNNLVRLRTPQLRTLNVSEKYMNEAKTLYFNADCRSFVPRGSITEVC